jgi:SAM-dependent methyltransferase
MSNSPPLIFDRALHLDRRSRADAKLENLLAKRIAEDLADRLALITRHFDQSLLIGDTNPLLAETLRSSGKIASLATMPAHFDDDIGLRENQFNAICSVLDLHAVNDVPGVLAQFARALKPDGLLMLCFFAGDTLFELRESFLEAESQLTDGATPRVAPMIGIRELGGLLQRAGLALPVTDLDRMTLRYGDALSLMREVKALGFSNPLADRVCTFTSRRLLFKAASHYAENFADTDTRVRATLELAWANAWKPHASQPQPLKPGSAKARLADALKVTEEKVPE